MSLAAGLANNANNVGLHPVNSGPDSVPEQHVAEMALLSRGEGQEDKGSRDKGSRDKGKRDERRRTRAVGTRVGAGIMVIMMMLPGATKSES